MGDNKITFISDRWSLEQLIDVQIRKSNERNRASIERLDALNRQFEEILSKEAIMKKRLEREIK